MHKPIKKAFEKAKRAESAIHGSGTGMKVKGGKMLKKIKY